MASGDQIKALLKSHAEQDEARFFAVAMQIAASEARRGHGKLAQEIKKLIDQLRSDKIPDLSGTSPTVIARPPGELAELLSASYPSLRLKDLVLGEKQTDVLKRVLTEQKKRPLLEDHGLEPRRKLLLSGPPGTGKTMTAGAIAGELGIALFVVRFDTLIARFLGDSAKKLKQIFEAVQRFRGVYLFDEFDSIGAERGAPNEVGEMRRLLNSFLQFIEQDKSSSIIIAATNHVHSLDDALFRRFDDVLGYDLPDAKRASQLLRNRLAAFPRTQIDWSAMARSAKGLNCADIVRAADDAMKSTLLAERKRTTEADLSKSIRDRKSAQGSSRTRK